MSVFGNPTLVVEIVGENNTIRKVSKSGIKIIL